MRPLAQYDDTRRAARGVDVAYTLSDVGRSTRAVAYLTRLSLRAARKRRKMWGAGGGASWPALDIDVLQRAFRLRCHTNRRHRSRGRSSSLSSDL